MTDHKCDVCGWEPDGEYPEDALIAHYDREHYHE